MRWILLAMAFGIFLVGCAQAHKYVVDMPGDRRVIYTQFKDTEPEGTDVNYALAWDCPSFQAFEDWKKLAVAAGDLGSLLDKIRDVTRPKCVVVGQFGSGSPGILKAVFNGVAGYSAIAAGIALQDFKGDSVSVSGTSSATAKSKAAATQKQFQRQHQQQTQPMMPTGGGGD